MKERSYGLDFIKIIGTILIFFHHYQQVTYARFEGVNFSGGTFNFAYIVELFFVISGYCICNYEKKIKDGLEFKKFYGKRAGRLLPIVAIVAVVYNFANAFHKSVFSVDWYGRPASLWSTITAMLGISQGWGLPESYINYPMWYISALLLCYCIFYFIVYIAKRCDLSTDYMFVFMIFLGMGGVTYIPNTMFMTPGLARGYYSFFFGILLKKYIDCKGISKNLVAVSVVIAILFPVLFIYCTEYVMDGLGYLLTFFFYPSIIVLVQTKIAKHIFCGKWIGVLSAISYDVFVWHLSLVIVFISLNEKFLWGLDYNNVLLMWLMLAISFVVGVLSHFFVEKPINYWLEKMM